MVDAATISWHCEPAAFARPDGGGVIVFSLLQPGSPASDVHQGLRHRGCPRLAMASTPRRQDSLTCIWPSAKVDIMPALRPAVTALLADDLDPAVGLRWFALGTAAAGSLWDDQATFDLSDRWVKMARAAGAFTTLPVALAFHAVSESMAGHFREADTRWALMLEVLTMSCGPGVLGVNSRSNGLLLAYRGQLTEARATGLAQVRESAARGQGGPADIGRYIVAMADLFGGDYATAMSSAETVIENDPAYTAEGALPELIEAAVRADDREAAATAHKTLSERALAAG